MAAIKAYFYKLRKDMPDICEGVDIPRYVDNLRMHFNASSLEGVDPATALPEGPIFYSDTPRDCHESSKKYELEDAISDCLRLFDRKGRAKKALSKLIAEKVIDDPVFREKMVAFGRVPQSWSEMLDPVDPEAMPTKKELAKKLADLTDRDYSSPTNARGKRHPLARIMETNSFSRSEKLGFIADYLVGRKRKGEAPRAVRIGGRGNYREFNRAHWLEQNGAFVLRTVGDIVRLQEHFTATHKLKRGSLPDLPQLEPGDLKPTIK